MKRVLITGGRGFIGSAVLSELAKRTDLLLTILDSNRMSPLPVREYPILTQFVEGSITDRELVTHLIQNNDVVVHLAAVVGTPACNINPNVAMDTNIMGTINLLSQIDRQIAIFASSADVYGRQPSGTVVTEETHTNPSVAYAVHKNAGEAIIKSAMARYIILRPSTTFGTSQQVRVDTLLNTFITKGLTQKHIDVFEPNVNVTFNHVVDVARVIVHAIDEKMPYGIYNVGNPDLCMTKFEAARRIAELTSSTLSLTEGADSSGRDFTISSEKILKTGFSFRFNDFAIAVEQMKEHLPILMRHPEFFTTSYWVQKSQEGARVYN